jgi:thiol-disulfide isomerase/thioredoxin
VAEGLTVAEDATGWQPRDEAFPDFELTDLAGRTWTREDLAGKTVLVNVWATWCQPCRKELPLIDELGERLAGDSDRTVVTLNADASIGLIQPFMDEHGYSFPVLLAADFFQNEFDELGLPQTWILDRTGTARLHQTGFDTRKADTWIEDILGRLDAVAGGE